MIENIGLQDIYLDVSTKLRQKTFYANEVDTNGRGLHAYLQDNGVKVDGTGVTMRLRYKSLNDGESKTWDLTPIGDPTNGEFEFHYPTEMVRGHGNKLFPCTIVASNPTSDLAFENIFVYVNKAEVNTEGIEASNEHSTLRKSLDDVLAVQEQLANITPEQITQVTTAETSRVTAENSRVTAETSRATAESSRVTAETNRVTAEDLRATAEATREANDLARGTYVGAIEANYAPELNGVKSQLAEKVSTVNGVAPDENGNVVVIADGGDVTGIVKSVNNVKPDVTGNVNVVVTGEGLVKSINNITPDEAGNIDGLATTEGLEGVLNQVNTKIDELPISVAEVYIESENSIEIPFAIDTTYYENIYAEQPLEMTISPNGIVRIRGKVRVKAKGSNPPIGSILEPRFALDSLPYQTSKFNILREAVSNANENHIIRFGPNNYWNPETPAIYRNAMPSLRKGANTYDLEFHVLDYSKLLVNAEVYIETTAYWRYFDKGFNYKQIVSKVRNLDGNKFNFIFAPDIHASVRDSRHGEGIKLMNKCQYISPMPIVTPGDIVNNYDKSEVVNGINQTIKKIGSNFLIAKGNHDDNSLKSKSVNDVITEQELKKLFFNNMKPSGFDVTISPDGMYYYADDTVRKIRIVVLNTHENDYTIVGGNITEDTASKGFINQKQLEFVAKEALNLKVQKGDDYTNWHTIFMGHYPLNFAGTKAYGGETCENGTEMWEIIKAFKNGTSVTIAPTSRSNTVHSLTGLTNNFASQGAMNVVGFFYGHYHNDQMQVKDGITLVTSECFSSVNYNTNWAQVERAVFSYDEFAFDIVSIDKSAKSVTLKRIGNDRLGDRSFNY